MSRIDRLKQLLDLRFNGKQKALATAIGRSPSHVSQWLTGKGVLGDASARNIETALGLASNWLDHGDGVSNVIPAQQGRLVPLISYVQAGGWTEIAERQTEKMIHVRESTPGANAFALTVEGDSMISDTTPTFPEGTVIIVDPDRAPKAGDYVVARWGTSATFKKLMTDGAMWYLRPLNRDYKTIELDSLDHHIVGVVIEYWTGGRL